MKTRWRTESDKWSTAVARITQPEKLAAIRETLEKRGSIIVTHWYYRGSSGPNRHVFQDYEEFVTYLNEKSFAGDIIEVWEFSSVCKPDNMLASGKCPDDKNEAPESGAY